MGDNMALQRLPSPGLSPGSDAAYFPRHLPRGRPGTQIVEQETKGDVAKEMAVEQRMRDLGLLESKQEIERRLSTRLDEYIQKKDALSGILQRCRRRRPLKSDVISAAAQIRGIFRPQIIRDVQGRRKEYQIQILMGHFTHDIAYCVDNNILAIFGACPGAQSEAKLTKEIRVEFPPNVIMEQLSATYSAGVFRASVPFAHAWDTCTQGSVPSVDTDGESRSMTSSDDFLEAMDSQSPLSDDSVTWV